MVRVCAVDVRAERRHLGAPVRAPEHPAETAHGLMNEHGLGFTHASRKAHISEEIISDGTAVGNLP